MQSVIGVITAFLSGFGISSVVILLLLTFVFLTLCWVYCMAYLYRFYVKLILYIGKAITHLWSN